VLHVKGSDAKIANHAIFGRTDVARYNTSILANPAECALDTGFDPESHARTFNQACPMPPWRSTRILGTWSSPKTTPS
jgi:hypothetical protein